MKSHGAGAQTCRRLRDATHDGAFAVLSNATMTYAKQVLAEAKRAQENEEEKGRAGKRSASYDAEKKLRSRRRVPLRAPRMRGCLTSVLPARRDDGSEGSTISSAFFEDVDLNEWIGVRVLGRVPRARARVAASNAACPLPRASVQELDAAAALVQAVWRGNRVRRAIRDLLQEAAVLRIQQFIRRHFEECGFYKLVDYVIRAQRAARVFLATKHTRRLRELATVALETRRIIDSC